MPIAMMLPLVETKLFRPASRPGAVPRPALTGRLSGAGRVVLLSAPAGFGKTTLLTRWLAGAHTTAPGGSAGDPGVAWVSLDEADRDAASFWVHVLTALDRAVPGAGAGALLLLQSGPAPIRSVLAAVVNELSVRPGALTLVLDDYHAADGPAVTSVIWVVLPLSVAVVRLLRTEVK